MQDLGQRVLDFLADGQPRGDKEVAKQLRVTRQYANKVCRDLARKRRLVRRPNPSGEVLNYLPR